MAPVARQKRITGAASSYTVTDSQVCQETAHPLVIAHGEPVLPGRDPYLSDRTRQHRGFGINFYSTKYNRNLIFSF